MKASGNSRHFAGVGFGVLLALAASAAVQAGVEFYQQPGVLTMAPGWTVTLDLGLGSYSNSPGAFSLRIEYDTNALRIVRITNDASSVFRDNLFITPLEQTTGSVRIAAFRAGLGSTARSDETPCHITWQATAQACTTSAVQLKVETFIDSAWQAVEVLSGGFSVVVDGTDSNTNGLPDFWEQAYFGSPTGAVRDADDDGDGMSNWQEYLAGTDPTNALSSLMITNISATADGQNLSFSSSRFRTYRLQAASALGTQAVWSNKTDTLYGTGGAVTVNDRNVTGPCFYRLQVNPP